jgi:CheY-like chemotaxis protein
VANVLIVDDEEDMRLAVKMLLHRLGHSTFEAPDGKSALSLLASSPVDVVLLDIRMPEMDGTQVLAKIRESHKDLPVVMVTGYGSVDTAVEVMRLGADDYISKPFHNHQLKAILEKVVEKRRLSASANGGVLQEHLMAKITGQAASSPPPAVPSNRRISWKRVSASVVAAMAIMTGSFWWMVSRVPASVSTSYPLDQSNPSALVWEGDSLWVADWLSQTVSRQSFEDNAFVKRQGHKLPAGHITGMAVVGSSLYTTDSWDKVIRRHNRDEALTVTQTVASPGPSPSGLFWDGEFLWSCDYDEGKVYKHVLDERLTVVASYLTPAPGLVGFYKDERGAWSANSRQRRFYRHRLDNLLSVESAYALEDLEIGTEPLSCFTWKDGRLWLARDGRAVLYRRAFDDLTAQVF